LIYFPHSAKFIKIGFSRNGFRVESTFNPYVITPLGCIDGDRERELELHHQFDHLRIRHPGRRASDWFHCDYRLVLFIADLLDAEHAAAAKENRACKLRVCWHRLHAFRRLKAKALKEKTRRQRCGVGFFQICSLRNPE
jgi:hypothetical protein